MPQKTMTRFLLPLCCWMLPGMVAAADLYSFTDESGIVHLSTTAYDSRFVLLLKGDDPVKIDVGTQKKPGASGKKQLASAYLPLVNDAAQLYRVDKSLLRAVIEVESGYNPDAVSPKGAVGLMQLMPATAKRYGVTNLKDPVQNLRGGAGYLRDLLDMFNNDHSLALAAYNSGENTVVRYGNRIPPYRETRLYVPKVIALSRHYAAQQ